jgi:hypothetical protein
MMDRVEWSGPMTHRASEIAWGRYRTRQQVLEKLERFELVPDGAELFTRYIAAYPED